MKQAEVSNTIGIALICVGVLSLFYNLGIAALVARLFWALLLAGSGAAFLLAFNTAAARWWLLVPGFALLCLAMLLIWGIQ